MYTLRKFSNWIAFSLFLVLDSPSLVYAHVAGHMKPFGSSGPFLAIKEVHGFPNTINFFSDHVHQSDPLKMTEAGRLSKAHDLWSDEYFLSYAMNEDNEILVEPSKKENRTSSVLHMHFHDFIREYSSQNYYMVDRVPDELRNQVLLPGPLQCPLVYEDMLIDAVMWMSSGGTSSVVHTDAVENILCLFDGEKKFVLIDPAKYGNNVSLDHPEGSYSGIDVDRVDYEKYPSLEGIEYHVVNLQGGDCLYIPYKWIHQVRSYGRNVAVNFWWNHNMSRLLDPNQCPSDVLDTSLTIEKVDFHGFESLNEESITFRDHLTNLLEDGVSADEFIRRFVDKEKIDADPSSGYRLPLFQIFLIIDKNRDKIVTSDEIEKLSEREWDMIVRQVERFEDIVDEFAKKRQIAARRQYGNREL